MLPRSRTVKATIFELHSNTACLFSTDLDCKELKEESTINKTFLLNDAHLDSIRPQLNVSELTDI